MRIFTVSRSSNLFCCLRGFSDEYANFYSVTQNYSLCNVPMDTQIANLDTCHKLAFCSLFDMHNLCRGAHELALCQPVRLRASEMNFETDGKTGVRST